MGNAISKGIMDVIDLVDYDDSDAEEGGNNPTTTSTADDPPGRVGPGRPAQRVPPLVDLAKEEEDQDSDVFEECEAQTVEVKAEPRDTASPSPAGSKSGPVSSSPKEVMRVFGAVGPVNISRVRKMMASSCRFLLTVPVTSSSSVM